MTDIIKDSIEFYRNNYRLILSVVAPVLILDILTNQIFSFFFITENSGLFIQMLPVILTFLFHSIYTAGLIILFGSLISGNNPSPTSCLKKAFSYLPLFIVTELISFVFIAGGFVLFIVPGVIIGIKLSLSQYFLILSDEMPLNAIKKSYRATNGMAGEMFYTMVVISLPIILAGLAIQLPLSLFNFPKPLLSIISDLVLGCITVIYPILFFRFFCIAQKAESQTNTP